jgi:cytochrome c-type biogenesis protein CcmH/NrfF
METFLTVLMALGIYVVFPLIVALVVCGAVIWRAKLRARRTQETAEEEIRTEVQELVKNA